MDLRQLRHFASVMDNRSFSVAARELRISQPALTRSIRALERRLGADLFARNQRGTRPTAAGLEFYRYATNILNDCRRATEEVAAIRTGGVGKVSVGVGASYVASVLVEVTARVTADLPSLELEVTEGLVEDLLDPLLDGRIDVILTTFATVPTRPDLVLEPLMEVAPMVVASIRHPLARKRTLTGRELAAASWASIDQPYTLDVLSRLFVSRRLPTPRPLRSNSLTLIKALVASGHYLSLLPTRAVASELRDGSFVTIPAEIPARPVEGGIVYLDRPVRSAAADRVMQLMRDACAAGGT